MEMCRRGFFIPVFALSIAITATALAAEVEGDDTVRIEGLEWSLKTSGRNVRWPDAIDYCDKLEQAGHDDWRLPTMDELKSLHDPESANGHGIRSPIVIDTCCLWSSESLADRPDEKGGKTGGTPDRYRWGLIFDGGDEYYAVDIYEDGQALCVRDAD